MKTNENISAGLKNKILPSFLICFILAITSAPAFAVPMDYTIFLTASPTMNLGTFTVDPDLASSMGVSEVQMTALTFEDDVAPFGTLTVSLADINPANVASFRAFFYNGNISEISGIGPGTLPGLSFFLDFTPKGDPTNIDLNAVGTYALDATDGIIFGDSATGSIGIRSAMVAEPGELIFLTSSIVLIAWCTRRKQRRFFKLHNHNRQAVTTN